MLTNILDGLGSATEWALGKISRMWKLSTTFKNSPSSEKNMRVSPVELVFILSQKLQLVWYFIPRYFLLVLNIFISRLAHWLNKFLE